MKNPELITADDLNVWPDKNARDAQENFPLLIRHLLLNTPGVSAVSARAATTDLRNWMKRSLFCHQDHYDLSLVPIKISVPKHQKTIVSDPSRMMPRAMSSYLLHPGDGVVKTSG